MNTNFRMRLALLTICSAGLAACDVFDREPEWQDLGQLPVAASTSLNHTPMVVFEDTVFIGTAEGLWRRPLNGSDDWEQVVGLEDLRIFAVRRHPTDGAVLFVAGEPLEDSQAAPFYRSDDGGETWSASTEWPQDPTDDTTEPFFDFIIASDDPDRLYANLSGASIAISTDGGSKWTLANGETDVLSGPPCVLQILSEQPNTLYQGCEEPADEAWIATYDIDPLDPLELENFTYLIGGPDLLLDDRRANSFASGPARPDTLYAGLEGSLLAIDETTIEFVFEADKEGSGDLPYAYIKGIWLDPNDGDHLIFGGGVAGENAELALFETDDHGDNIEQLAAPRSLNDPVVEQIVPIDDDNLAILISEDDSSGDERSLRVLVLDSNGDPFN